MRLANRKAYFVSGCLIITASVVAFAADGRAWLEVPPTYTPGQVVQVLGGIDGYCGSDGGPSGGWGYEYRVFVGGTLDYYHSHDGAFSGGSIDVPITHNYQTTAGVSETLTFRLNAYMSCDGGGTMQMQDEVVSQPQ